jgi:hypothetical protein
MGSEVDGPLRRHPRHKQCLYSRIEKFKFALPDLMGIRMFPHENCVVYCRYTLAFSFVYVTGNALGPRIVKPCHAVLVTP